MLPDKLAFVDLETTGTSFYSDRILEIGILRVEKNKLVRTFHSLVNPQTYISPNIEMITGISKDAVESAPVFDSLWKDVLEVLDDCVFVSHNVAFDYGFLKHEYARLGLNSLFNYKKFCTVKLSRALFPSQGRHNLDSVIQAHHIPCENRHRALDDAKVIWQFYQILQEKVDPQILSQAIKGSLKRATFPKTISESEINNLPQGPGVYIFYGKEGMPLYVGKSINIRDRVISHFSDIGNSKEIALAQQVESIEVIPTAGELSALIKEAQLIKTMLPLYNRQLRRLQQLLVLLKNQNQAGYITTQLVTTSQITAADTANVLGIFKSKRQAINILREISKTNYLCPKLLGYEKASKGCTHRQFGWCKGACVLEEPSYLYNTRVIEAFNDFRIDPWPFAGPINIQEKSEINDLENNLVFDQWCYMEESQKELGTVNPENLIFDRDIYKIIKRFLRKESNQLKIQSINPRSSLTLSF